MIIILYIGIDQALEFAVAKGSEEFLEKALEMCDEFSYNKSHVKSARRLLKRIKRVKEEATVAVRMAIEDQVRFHCFLGLHHPGTCG